MEIWNFYAEAEITDGWNMASGWILRTFQLDVPAGKFCHLKTADTSHYWKRNKSSIAPIYEVHITTVS